MSYIGNEPIVSATRTVTEVTATAGQTTFTANGGYTVGFIDVFINGSQLQSSDFTATNGSTVVLTNACAVNDDVRLVAYGSFSVSAVDASAVNSGTLAYARMPVGSVLQVVQGSTTTYTTTSSTSFVATDLYATITPKFSTSKILILVETLTTNTISTANTTATIYRNSTNLGSGAYSGFSGYQPNLVGGTYVWVPTCINYLDSPASTSALTYKLYVNTTAGGQAYINSNALVSTITLLEIAG